ncbi:MAG: 30S ribosomal protein S1 [Armatimonadota bacterium]|nr:30S ribosomal protein S1 [Armatimonadota bacterium]
MCAWDFEDSDQEEQASEEAQTDEKQELEEQADPEAQEAEEPEEPEAEDEILTMDDVDLDDVGPAELRPGDILTGIVVAVREDGVLVDIGGKAEGVVPIYEFLDRSELPEADDEIEVAVAKLRDDDGMTVLSKKRADYERVWNRVMRALETGEILDAMVTDRVKGGLRVDLGVPGFVPASHVATRNVRNLDRFVGRSLRLKVLEADRHRKKVVLSHREVVEEERRKRKQETMAELEEGLVCEGKVRNITEYGAFIDLGGVDGLLHISEMAWGRVDHPSDVCSVGDTLRVVVLDIDRERERISLGRRQILPDPWKEVGKKLRPGNTVSGRVSRIVRTGAFVELPDYEVEGFLPVGELAERRIENPSEVIEEGQELDLKVLKLRAQARRMTLSLVAAVQEKERREYQKYMADQETPPTTLGDQFADVLGAVAAELDEDVGSEAEAGEAEAAEEAKAADQAQATDEPEAADEAEAAETPEESEEESAQDSADEAETVESEGGVEEGDEEGVPEASVAEEAAGEEGDETEADDAEGDQQ